MALSSTTLTLLRQLVQLAPHLVDLSVQRNGVYLSRSDDILHPPLLAPHFRRLAFPLYII